MAESCTTVGGDGGRTSGVSAYQFPAATPSYPMATSADPTAVMGRRIAAVVIDFLLYLLIMAFVGPTPLSPLAEFVDQNDNPGVTCDEIQDLNDVSGCVDIGDRLYFTETDDAAVQFIVWGAVVLLYAALQGATGVTPGKALLGVKVVDEHGRRPGFGRSLLRTILWVVDAAPWCLPLVGFVTGLTTKGHRRVGDMAAKTFVVGKAHTGPVFVPGLATAATGGYPGAPGAYGAPGQPWGAPPPGAGGGPPTAWGAPPQAQQPGGWGPPPSGGYPAAGSPGPTSGDRRPAPPTSWTPPGGEPATPARPATAPGPRGDAPTAKPDDRPGPADAPPRPGADTGRDTGTGTEPSPGASTTEAPAAGPTAGAPPSGGTAPTGTAPTGTAPPTAATEPTPQAATTSYNPQWDAARGTYIVSEPNRGKWLGWDEAAKEWKPL